jgi:hypothetical protein
LASRDYVHALSMYDHLHNEYSMHHNQYLLHTMANIYTLNGDYEHATGALQQVKGEILVKIFVEFHDFDELLTHTDLLDSAKCVTLQT